MTQRPPKSRETDTLHNAIVKLRRYGVAMRRIAGDLHDVGGIPLSSELLVSAARGIRPRRGIRVSQRNAA